MGLMETLARREEDKKIVRVADDILQWAAQGNGPWRVGDLIPVVEAAADASITIREGGIDARTVGFTEREGTEATITISSECATWEHTLAHELGHVVLGHRLCSLDDLTPPAACEDLSRIISRELAEHAAPLEREAEIFADRVMKLLPSAETQAQASPVAVLWKSSF